MRLAEHESERHDEELIALIVADMQDPVTPILKVALVGDGLHEVGRMIARLSEIVHHDAAVIEENLLRVGPVEVYLGHVHSSRRVAPRSRRCWCPRRRGAKDGSGDALQIWNHI